MEKYYYQTGFCTSLGYLSQNPVAYNKDSNKMYRKSHMFCSMVEKGQCDKSKTCQLLEDAPDILRDDGRQLYSRKL